MRSLLLLAELLISGLFFFIIGNTCFSVFFFKCPDILWVVIVIINYYTLVLNVPSIPCTVINLQFV